METQTQNRQATAEGGGVTLEAIPVGTTRVDDIGNGGNRRFDKPLSLKTRIVGMNVMSGDFVDSIQMVVNDGGEDLTLELYGGPKGKLRPLTLDRTKGEYIASIEVRYGEFIDSLTFNVPGRAPQKFGGSGGSNLFTLAGPPGTEVCGIHGWYGEFLNRLGIYYRERTL